MVVGLALGNEVMMQLLRAGFRVIGAHGADHDKPPYPLRFGLVDQADGTVLVHIDGFLRAGMGAGTGGEDDHILAFQGLTAVTLQICLHDFMGTQ